MKKIQSSSKYFYTDKGLLLYNSYEASYADGPKELLLPYVEVEEFLRLK
jgi:hypothetical protein